MFGFRLREPAKGDRITADWARELVKAVRAMRLQQGPGIRLTRTPEGTTISAVPSAATAGGSAPGAGGGSSGGPDSDAVAKVLGGPDSDAVAKVLGGTDYNAATDSWAYGETDQTTGKPTYPVFNPTRLYWQESVHTLWMFRRTETYNSSGLLVAVSAETRTSVFVTVAEMP